MVTVGECRKDLKALKDIVKDPTRLHQEVEKLFKRHDKDSNSKLELTEIQALVKDLCLIMNLPVPTDEEFKMHVAILDQNKDSALSEHEVGSGLVAAFNFRIASYEHYLAFADRDKLPDSAELPRH